MPNSKKKAKGERHEGSRRLDEEASGKGDLATCGVMIGVKIPGIAALDVSEFKQQLRLLLNDRMHWTISADRSPKEVGELIGCWNPGSLYPEPGCRAWYGPLLSVGITLFTVPKLAVSIQRMQNSLPGWRYEPGRDIVFLVEPNSPLRCAEVLGELEMWLRDKDSPRVCQ